jgi:hypothetical protein
MHTVLYFSPDGVIYEARAYTKADIAALVYDFALESLTSADRQFDFWFTPSAQPCHRHVTTGFTADTVPLLRGAVVVATHDSDGGLDGLSWQQLDLLAERNRSLTRRDGRVLRRRISRDVRSSRARSRSRPLIVGDPR